MKKNVSVRFYSLHVIHKSFLFFFSISLLSEHEAV